MANKLFEVAFRISGQLDSGFGAAMGSAKATLTSYGNQISDLKSKQKGLQGALRDVQESQRELNAAMDGSAVAKYQAEMQALDAKAAGYRKSIADLDAKQERLNAKFQAGKISSAQLETGLAAIAAKSAQYNTRLTSVVAEQDRLTAAFNRGRVSEETYNAKMAELNSKAQEYANNLKRVGTQLDEVSAKNQRMRTNMAAFRTSSENFANAKASFQSTALTVAAMAAPIVAATASAVNFETSMNAVAKQVQDARDDNLQYTQTYYDMRSGIQQMSNEMGILPDKVAAATAASARMGVQGKESIQEFTSLSLKMGEAFEADAETVATSMAKIAKVRNIDINTKEGMTQFRELADAINYLDDQTTANGGEIIDTLQRISGTASTTSFTTEELAALSTTMIEGGDSAEIAATGLNAFMTKLSTAPQQGKAFQQTLQQMGLDANQLQQDFLRDSKGTTLKLLEQINSMAPADKASALTNLFGAEYQDNIAKLAANVNGLKDNFNRLNDTAKNGSIDKEFAARMETTAGKLNILKANVANTAINIGSIFLPALAEGAQWLSNNVMWVANLAGQYPNVTKGVIEAAAAVAGLVLAYKGINAAVEGIKTARAAIKLLTESEQAATIAMRAGAVATRIAAAAQWAFNSAMWANPVTWVIVGIVALAAALIWVAYNWDYVKEVAVAACQWIGNQAEWLWGVISGGFSAVVDWLSSGWANIKQFAIDAWDAAWNAVDNFVNTVQSTIAQFVQGVIDKWNELKGIFSSPITAVVNWVQNKIGGAPDGVNVKKGYADGDIVKQGPHLAWFAEKYDEAYIPINNSERSRNLWRRTGELLGMPVPGSSGRSLASSSSGLWSSVSKLGNNDTRTRTQTASGDINISMPVNITVSGNADASTVKQIQDAMRREISNLERKLAEIQHRKERVGFA